MSSTFLDLSYFWDDTWVEITYAFILHILSGNLSKLNIVLLPWLFAIPIIYQGWIWISYSTLCEITSVFVIGLSTTIKKFHALEFPHP